MMTRLYHRESCPASRKVRRVLDGAGVAYEAINVPKLASERKQVLALRGVTDPQVPVLVEDDDVYQGSEKILEHLRDRYAGRFGDPPYALTRRVQDRDFEQVVGATRSALASEGFGVLTEIDVKATMKKKLDADVPDYLILGACNPSLAHQALSQEPGIGVLLPCNVVVAKDRDDGVVISAVDPVRMFSVVDQAELEPIARDVREKLVRALTSI
jgi:uncharacterized protein (DUF302 family)/glutaredoxin